MDPTEEAMEASSVSSAETERRLGDAVSDAQTAQPGHTCDEIICDQTAQRLRSMRPGCGPSRHGMVCIGMDCCPAKAAVTPGMVCVWARMRQGTVRRAMDIGQDKALSSMPHG